jgi:nitrogen fixation/metabolism regulation signal transduction histidine kinase
MVLNHERQIVAANQQLITLLNRPAEALLGMRVGEAFDCIHSKEEPGGCGTALACRMCGLAKATLTSWTSSAPSVQECRLTCHGPHGWQSLDLRVFAAPVHIDHEHFTVISLVDITDEKRRLVLEQMFFHDAMNTASGIHGVLDLLPDLADAQYSHMLQVARDLSRQLVEEIRAGNELGAAERGELQVSPRTFSVRDFLGRICELYRHVSVSYGKTIREVCVPDGAIMTCDDSLLGRIMGNLIKNAVEASSPGETVTVTFHAGPPAVFSVHNPSVIPETVKLQIFQRSFSTKAAQGRGIGAYSVKMLAERYLHGAVAFRSLPGEGTTFTVTLA